MKTKARHLEFAIEFRKFLSKKGFRTPVEFHRDLEFNMGPHAPKKATVYAAFYGSRLLPITAVLFMQERYGFKVRWPELLEARNMDGAMMKNTTWELPGMREIKEEQELKRRESR